MQILRASQRLANTGGRRLTFNDGIDYLLSGILPRCRYSVGRRTAMK